MKQPRPHPFADVQHMSQIVEERQPSTGKLVTTAKNSRYLLMGLNIVLNKVAETREERLALCSLVFGRTIASTKELRICEIAAFNIMAHELVDDWQEDAEFISRLQEAKEQINAQPAQ